MSSEPDDKPKGHGKLFEPGNQAALGHGAPSKFEPRFCQLVIDFMSGGYSLHAFAGSVGIGRATVNRWIAAHPEFADAVEIGKSRRLLDWETVAIKIRDGGGERDQFAMATLGLYNMSPEEWGASPKQKHELSGPNGGPIASVDISKLSNDQLAALEPVLVALAGSGGAPRSGQGGEGEAGG